MKKVYSILYLQRHSRLSLNVLFAALSAFICNVLFTSFDVGFLVITILYRRKLRLKN